MFEKKCSSCAEKVDRKFNYCPWCGASLKIKMNDMGMIGDSDSGQLEDIKLPFGVEKIMGGLVKQLEKQLGNMDIDERTGMPKGLKIQIGKMPINRQPIQNKSIVQKSKIVIPKEELKRRSELKKVDAKSKVKRLGDVIIYEIVAPGVSKPEDVVISELETGIEIRVYAREKCYIKVIPLKVEVLRMRIDGEKVSVELKG